MTRYVALLLLSSRAFAQTDWPSFGNDPGAMRYSSLRQIDSGNVERLRPAWTFRTGKPGSEGTTAVVRNMVAGGAQAPEGDVKAIVE